MNILRIFAKPEENDRILAEGLFAISLYFLIDPKTVNIVAGTDSMFESYSGPLRITAYYIPYQRICGFSATHDALTGEIVTSFEGLLEE